MEDALQLSKQNIRKLIGTGSGDAALLYLYLETGGSEDRAADDLHFTAARFDTAMALLRRIGMVANQHRFIRPSDPPAVSEQDIFDEVDKNNGFSTLLSEIEVKIGRKLSTEELKILISFRNYLALPDEVILILVSFCLERGRARGTQKSFSIRAVQKEAYYWADEGIDTIESACLYVKQQLDKQSKMGTIRRAMQIHGRKLTATEEGYIEKWLSLGFGEQEIALAYDKTCVQKGSLNWNYMDAIISSWQSQNLFTVSEIQKKDSGAPVRRKTGKSQGIQSASTEELDPMIKKAVEEMFAEESNGV